MKLIVGLGNPGKKYDDTRHNVGFAIIDFLAKAWEGDPGFFFFGSERHALYESTEWEYRSPTGQVEKVVLAKPQTFMNLSGDAVHFLAHHSPRSFTVQDDLWVVHDDVDVDFGRIKLDRDRSAGGHNGIKHIIDRLGTKDFIRFRVGVRQEKREEDTERFVLKRFTASERRVLPIIFSLAREGIACTLEQGFETAQNIINGRNAKISA